MGDFGQQFVYSARVRGAAFVYIGVAATCMTVVGAAADSAAGYLTAWAAAGLVYPLLAVLLAPRALREVDPASTPLGVWYVGNSTLYVGAGLVYLVGVRDWDGGRPLLLPLAVVGVAVYGLAHALCLRARSGQRAMVVDLFDILVATVATVGPFALLLAEPIATSEHAWLTVPAAVVAIGGIHMISSAFLTILRLSAADRVMAAVSVGLCAVTVVDAAAQVAQGLTDFALPPGPLVGIHTLAMSGCLLVGAGALRGKPVGLDRFPPQRQVRQSGPLAVLVLASVVLVVAEMLWLREDGWVVAGAVILLALLVVLSMLRQVWLTRETARLYAEVELAANERRDLLGEVMLYIDDDRTRAAAQIHRQAARLYTSVAISMRADGLANQIRLDLARQVDSAYQVLGAMATSRDEPADLRRLVGLIRAYVGTSYGDERTPALQVDIADGLVVDWLEEAVAFRIVQLAVHNIVHHAQARTIGVTMKPRGDALTVHVSDDGVGFDTAGVVAGTGFRTMQSLASLVSGHVEVGSSPRVGTHVFAMLPCSPPAPARTGPAGRTLRLVTGGKSRT